MSIRKIHEDSDVNTAEKVVESLLHWVISNKNMVIGTVVAVAIILAGFGSFSYMQKKNLETAKTEYGRIFIEMQKSGKYNEDALMGVYETSSEKVFAGLAAYQIAMLALEKGDYQKSVEWFDNALTKKPSAEFILSSIYEGKGVALEFMGQKDEALANYTKSLESKKSSYRRSDVRMKIALLKRNSGDVASAKEECDAIVADTLATPEMIQNAKNLLLAL